MKNHAKRLMMAAVLTVATTMALGAAAQEVNINFGQQDKGLAKAGAQRVLGSDGNSVVYLTQTGVMVPNRTIVSYDMAQREQASVKLGKIKLNGSWGLSCREAMVNGSKIDLLMVNRADDNLLVTRERRDMSTLALEGEPQVIADLKGGRNDELFVFSAVSPNRQLVAVATAKVEAGLGAEVRVSLYSREFEEYWSIEVPAYGFVDMIVNNEGEVAMTGLDEKDGRVAVQATVTDGEKTEHMDFSYKTSGVMIEWEPAYYANGRLVLVSAMREESKTIMRVGVNIDCLDAVSLDMTSGEVSVDHHRFSEEELADMENKKGLTTSYHWMNFGNLRQVLTDDEGAFVVIDNQWDTYSQYGLTHSERRGMMVLRVDKDGRIRWTRTERTYVKAASGLMPWASYRWVPTADGIMLAWTTNAKDAMKNRGETVKGLKVFDGGAELTVMTLDREGNAKKTRYGLGKQTLLLSPTEIGTDEWLLFVSDRSKGAFGRLTIRK